jgi:hypothetical protein
MPAFFASLAQLFRCRLHKDLDAALFGQDRIAQLHAHGIREVVLAVVAHGNVPRKENRKQKEAMPRQESYEFFLMLSPERSHPDGVFRVPVVKIGGQGLATAWLASP